MEITKPRSRGPICDFLCGAATAIGAGILITGAPLFILAGVAAYIVVLVFVMLAHYVLSNLTGE